MFHGDPAVLLQHGDYRGFVTETSPAKRGDYLHLLISGVPPGSTADAAMLATSASGSGRSTVSLPVVAVSATAYHPAITQITVRIPEDAVDLPVRGVVANFSLRMWLPDGQAAAGFFANAYLKY